MSSCFRSNSDFEKIIGVANARLTYEDGELKLLYEGGDAYSSGVLRSAEITFICSSTAGDGHPEFAVESGRKRRDVM